MNLEEIERLAEKAGVKKRTKSNSSNNSGDSSKSKKSLTLKQSLYIEGRKSGLNKKKAALKAGYSESTADNVKTAIEEKIGKDRILKSFNDCLLEKGIDNTYLAQIIAKLLDKKLFTRVYDEKGRFTGYEESIDTQAVVKGLDMVFKLRGDYAAPKVQIENSSREYEHLTNDELDMMIAEGEMLFNKA